MRALIIFLLYYLIFTPVIGQIKNSKVHSREVVIQIGDTLVRSNILTGDLNRNPGIDKTYYWYSKGMILSNTGGYAGKLLHGEYQAFLDNRLIVSGQFTSGIKSGIWKSWYPSGKMKEICSFKDGTLSGQYFYYSENGTLEQKGIYKNGKYYSDLKKVATKSTDKSQPVKRIKNKKELNKETTPMKS